MIFLELFCFGVAGPPKKPTPPWVPHIKLAAEMDGGFTVSEIRSMKLLSDQ